MGIAQATEVKALGTMSSSVASKWKPLQGPKTVVKGHSCWMQRYKSPELQPWLMMKLSTRTSHLQSDGHTVQGFTLSSSSILWPRFWSLKVIVYLEAILGSLKWHMLQHVEPWCSRGRLRFKSCFWYNAILCSSIVIWINGDKKAKNRR